MLRRKRAIYALSYEPLPSRTYATARVDRLLQNLSLSLCDYLTHWQWGGGGLSRGRYLLVASLDSASFRPFLAETRKEHTRYFLFFRLLSVYI